METMTTGSPFYATGQNAARLPLGAPVSASSTSKHQLQLNPHAANAAVGKIAVEKLPGQSIENVPGRNVDVLRMIEGV